MASACRDIKAVNAMPTAHQHVLWYFLSRRNPTRTLNQIHVPQLQLSNQNHATYSQSLVSVAWPQHSRHCGTLNKTLHVTTDSHVQGWNKDDSVTWRLWNSL